jgi:hypothetical protein
LPHSNADSNSNGDSNSVSNANSHSNADGDAVPAADSRAERDASWHAAASTLEGASYSLFPGTREFRECLRATIRG